MQELHRVSAPLTYSGLHANPWRNNIQYNPRPPPFSLAPLCNSHVAKGLQLQPSRWRITQLAMEFKFPFHLIFCESIKHKLVFFYRLWINAPLTSSGLQTNPWRNSLNFQYNPRPSPFPLTPLCNSQRHKRTFTVFLRINCERKFSMPCWWLPSRRNRARNLCTHILSPHPFPSELTQPSFMDCWWLGPFIEVFTTHYTN